MRDLQNLRHAIANNAPPNIIENLHTRMWESKAFMNKTKHAFDLSIPYYTAAINRRSYLYDTSKERFPGQDLAEVNKFSANGNEIERIC